MQQFTSNKATNHPSARQLPEKRVIPIVIHSLRENHRHRMLLVGRSGPVGRNTIRSKLSEEHARDGVFRMSFVRGCNFSPTRYRQDRGTCNGSISDAARLLSPPLCLPLVSWGNITSSIMAYATVVCIRCHHHSCYVFISVLSLSECS